MLVQLTYTHTRHWPLFGILYGICVGIPLSEWLGTSGASHSFPTTLGSAQGPWVKSPPEHPYLSLADTRARWAPISRRNSSSSLSFTFRAFCRLRWASRACVGSYSSAVTGRGRQFLIIIVNASVYAL